MSSDEPKKKLVGPWQSIHVIIWVIGLYILFTRGAFFPGILVLIAISALYEAVIRWLVPQAYVEIKPSEAAPTTQPASVMMTPSSQEPAAPPMAAVQEHRIDLLPQVCPSCNAPIRGHEVRWTGPQSANCPYCGTNLPMNKG